MGNLASLLENSAEKYADRTAIVFGDSRFTYAQVNGAANQVANLLVSRGIKPGDKVALSCPNLPYFSIIYFGILKAGGTVVPLNVLLKAPRGGLPPRRLRGEGVLRLRGHARAAHRRGRLGGLPGHRLVHGVLPHQARLRGARADGAAGVLRAARRRAAADVRHRRDRRRRHRRHPLHVGHDRPAQGRRAPAPQHARQRAHGAHDLFGADREQPRHLPVRPAAVPLLRPDRHPERRVRVRRHRRDAAAVRGRAGPAA